MAAHVGIEGVVKLGANAVALVTGFSADVAHEMIDVTTLTDTSKQIMPAGKYSWNAQCECLWDETDTNGQLALETALTAGTSVTLNLYPEGATTGDKYLTGTAYVTSMGVSVSEGAAIKRTVAFAGTGALTFGTAA
jgi:hypothetical protein